MRIADRLNCIKPSATLAVNAKALELKSKGIQVASLAIGEPDFATPAHICAAAKAAMDAGHTRYTAVAGIPELRKAVGGYFSRTYGVDVPTDSVVISNGGKHSLFNIFQALLNPGDEVLIPAPYWTSYPDMVLLATGVPVSVPAGSAQGFKITPASLEKYVSPKTRMLIFNSPSNPTGVVYTRAELDSIMQWAVDNDIFVVSDEIYDQLVYAPATATSVITWWQRFPEKFAIMNGVAKTFAMTGWRVGYAVVHPALAKAMVTLQGQSTSSVCSVAQWAAVAALNGPMDDAVTMKEHFLRRRDRAWSTISSWEGVVCPKPEGAFYLFADMSALYTPQIADSAQLCTHLLEEAHVALVPGVAFGDDACVRFSYAVADTVLDAALERIGNFLHKVRA
ncbi:MAG: pyridoxal phosphate-dependent aminotransferase [Desulfovibrionaceae bacterium]